MVAHGRFGRVYKGKLVPGGDDGDEDESAAVVAAVKIIQEQEKQSWKVEQEIYGLPRMDHRNILKYIGHDKQGNGLDKEYRLFTEFHDRGE